MEQGERRWIEERCGEKNEVTAQARRRGASGHVPLEEQISSAFHRAQTLEGDRQVASENRFHEYLSKHFSIRCGLSSSSCPQIQHNSPPFEQGTFINAPTTNS